MTKRDSSLYKFEYDPLLEGRVVEMTLSRNIVRVREDKIESNSRHVMAREMSDSRYTFNQFVTDHYRCDPSIYTHPIPVELMRKGSNVLRYSTRDCISHDDCVKYLVKMSRKVYNQEEGKVIVPMFCDKLVESAYYYIYTYIAMRYEISNGVLHRKGEG